MVRLSGVTTGPRIPESVGGSGGGPVESMVIAEELGFVGVTAVVALFAVSDPARSGPGYDLDKHVIIRKWRTCNPCFSKNCPYAEPICMDNIAVDEVVAAVDTILSRELA